MYTITLTPNRQTVPFATATVYSHERRGDKLTPVVKKYRSQRGKVSLTSVSQLPFRKRDWSPQAKRDWLILRGALTSGALNPGNRLALEDQWEKAVEAKLAQQHPKTLGLDYKGYICAMAEVEVANA